jgi:hypothetical protein
MRVLGFGKQPIYVNGQDTISGLVFTRQNESIPSEAIEKGGTLNQIACWILRSYADQLSDGIRSAA